MAIGSHRQHSHCVPSPAEGSFYAPDSNSSGRLLLGKKLGGREIRHSCMQGEVVVEGSLEARERERGEKKVSRAK